MKKQSNVVKKEIRVLGIDDSPFSKSEKKCMIVGTVFRGGNYIDGLLSAEVHVDGDDSTEKIAKLARKTRHYDQLSCILLDGIAVAGFNVVDINELSRKTGIPVIVIMRKMPSMKKIERALKSFLTAEKAEKRMNLIKKAGRIFSASIQKRKVYFQAAGISGTRAIEIIRITSTHSLIPEPLRVAHLIAQGIIKGESRGRA